MKRTLSMLLAGVVLLSPLARASAQDAVEGPDTLFLTWFGDPTTSIVAQWLEEGDPLPLVEGASDDVPAFDVPRVAGISIDGDTDDWADRGLDVGFLAGDDGAVYDAADLGMTAYLAWDERGLIVRVHVTDDVAVESESAEELWSADSLELFISTGVGSGQRYQALIVPGATGEGAEPKHFHYDYRQQRRRPIAFDYACRVIEGGYVVEILLPWSNLGIEPQDGDTVGFQFYVNDRDNGDEVKGLWWHPDRDAHERPESMYGIRLVGADIESRGAVARAKVETEEQRAVLRIWAGAEQVGRTVTATSGGHVIGEGVIELHDGDASATIALADAPQGARWGTIRAELDGEPIAHARPQKWMTVSRPESVPVQLLDLPPFGVKGRATEVANVNTELTPFGAHSGLFLHRVEFEGLVPNGEYGLRIADPASTIHSFRTAPATLEEPVVFAEGGDIGTGANVAPLHRTAAGWSPLFGLIGGDCAYANGRTPQRWVDYLRLWRANMVDPHGRLIPMLCAIGNHEVDGSFGQPRERSPFFLALFDGLYPEHSYATIDFGDYLSLVLLDSGHLESHDSQAAWLDAALAERRDRPHLFTAYHVPAYPSHRDFEGKYSELARVHWVPLFEKHGVHTSFEHHDHTYKRTHRLTGGEPDPGGVLYMGDGAWGMNPRTVATPAERPYLAKTVSASHVIRVTIDGGQRRFLAVDVDGNVIDEYPQ